MYTDGSAWKGEGGWAWWWGDGPSEQGSGHVCYATNNTMELVAVIEAIRADRDHSDLVIVSDSQYVVHCMLERWYDRWREDRWKKPAPSRLAIANRELWEELLAEIEAHRGTIEWVHTRGHGRGLAEHRHGNSQADALAGQARKACA